MSGKQAASPSALVIGAGVFGCAVADALARRGWAVTSVERHAPANARGSSGDRTRLLRHGHGTGDEAEDRLYVRLAARGIALWRELSAEQELPLIEQTGLVWLAGSSHGVEPVAWSRLTSEGIPCELLGPEEVAAHFPEIAVDDLELGLYEPQAGVIRARDGVLALLRRALRHGTRLEHGTARPAGAGSVRLDDGRTLHADHVVWACGAWLGALFPEAAPIRPTWQEVVHWQAPPEWSAIPAWFDEAAVVYGFPDVDGVGIKAATHRPGRTLDPDLDARQPDGATLRELADYLERRFPGLRPARLLWARVMPYEMTPDHNFVVGPAGDAERHWVLGGGSGHGFKHALALGEMVAELLEHGTEPPALFRPGPREARSTPSP